MAEYTERTIVAIPPNDSLFVSHFATCSNRSIRSLLRSRREQFDGVPILMLQALVYVIEVQVGKAPLDQFVVLVVEADYIGGIPRHGNHFIIPARMDNSKVITLKGNRQRAEESTNSLLNCRIRKHLRSISATLIEELFAPEPLVLWLPMVEQDIQVVVAKDALRLACINQRVDKIDDCRAVWPSVSQITQENQSSALGMPPVPAIVQMPQQRTQCVDLAVNITHDVERAVEKWADEGEHLIHHFCKRCITDQTS